jgi:putative acetyltransferase
VSSFVIGIDDPRAADVHALLERHLEFCRATSPPEDVHALDLDGLLEPAVTFYGVRRGGELLAIGAIKELDSHHAELKSMHTAAAARGQGAARALVDHLLAVARQRGYTRVSLETGTMDAFVAARTLYQTAGFAACEPFGSYSPSPNSTCMTLLLNGCR